MSNVIATYICRGWIPAFAGMTEVGDLGLGSPLDNPHTFP